MIIALVPNTTKKDILSVVLKLAEKLYSSGFRVIFSDLILKNSLEIDKIIPNAMYFPMPEIFYESDIVISIGGDGTMLNTAFEARNTKIPMAGLNFGKLGFLAEVGLDDIDKFINEIKQQKFYIEERMAIEGACISGIETDMYAINDIVIDKGGWPKMIEITIQVDGEYVSTFSADGIVVSTPTGSTGYSLSGGGPIVSPKADVITLTPIAPHTLTMRPLIISGEQKIILTVKSQQNKIQINCDGQRVYFFTSPVGIEIKKSDKPMRILHTHTASYYEILRTKLLWGLDVRSKNGEQGN